jgi:hypothetical protein
MTERVYYLDSRYIDVNLLKRNIHLYYNFHLKRTIKVAKQNYNMSLTLINLNDIHTKYYIMLSVFNLISNIKLDTVIDHESIFIDDKSIFIDDESLF